MGKNQTGWAVVGSKADRAFEMKPNAFAAKQQDDKKLHSEKMHSERGNAGGNNLFNKAVSDSSNDAPAKANGTGNKLATTFALKTR